MKVQFPTPSTRSKQLREAQEKGKKGKGKKEKGKNGKRGISDRASFASAWDIANRATGKQLVDNFARMRMSVEYMYLSQVEPRCYPGASRPGGENTRCRMCAFHLSLARLGPPAAEGPVYSGRTEHS